jgi:hypothetical protein
MAYQTLPVRRARQVVPAEARPIADELLAIGQEARDLGQRVHALMLDLDANWEGRSKLRIVDALRTHPGAGASTAAWLEAQARRVACFTVTIWETVWERVWQPDP